MRSRAASPDSTVPARASARERLWAAVRSAARRVDLTGTVGRLVVEENRALRARNDELERLNQRLARLSVTDELTGLPNHRSFRDSLSREIKRSLRDGSDLALVLFDVDDFKRLNDTHAGEIDLPQQRLNVVTWIPVGALTDQAAGMFNTGLGSLLGRAVPEFERLTMAPWRTSGSFGNTTTLPAPALFAENVGGRLLRPDKMIRDIFSDYKKPKPPPAQNGEQKKEPDNGPGAEGQRGGDGASAGGG
jgi:hypothetical protein